MVYRKLPGSGAVSSFQRTRLYAGTDHILQVTSNGFTETYQRFFFADIQAIVLNYTITGKVWNYLLGGLAAFTVLITSTTPQGAWLPLLSIAAFWLVLMAVNVILGPTCACFIKTAVQTQRLPALRRARRARRVIQEHLRPLVHQAQGELSPEELHRRLDPAARHLDSGGSAWPAGGTLSAM